MKDRGPIPPLIWLCIVLAALLLIVVLWPQQPRSIFHVR